MSFLKIQKAEAHVLYRCMAYNKVGVDSRIILFHVTRKTLLFPSDPLMSLPVFIVLPCPSIRALQVASR